jgi:hypothetical protein
MDHCLLRIRDAQWDRSASAPEIRLYKGFERRLVA